MDVHNLPVTILLFHTLTKKCLLFDICRELFPDFTSFSFKIFHLKKNGFQEVLEIR